MVQKKITKEISLSLEFFSSEGTDLSAGIIKGGVIDTDLRNLSFNIEDKEEFDFIQNKFISNGNQLILKADKKSLYELGKLLVGMALFETPDPNYHEHFENVSIDGKVSQLIVYRT